MGEAELVREGIAKALVDQLWMKGLISDIEREEICNNLREKLQKTA